MMRYKGRDIGVTGMPEESKFREEVAFVYENGEDLYFPECQYLNECTIRKDTVAHLIAETPHLMDWVFGKYTGCSGGEDLKYSHDNHNYYPTIQGDNAFEIALQIWCRNNDVTYYSKGQFHGKQPV